MTAPANIPTLVGLGLLLLGVIALLVVGVGLAVNGLVSADDRPPCPSLGARRWNSPRRSAWPTRNCGTSREAATIRRRALGLAIGVPDREMKPLLPSPNAEAARSLAGPKTANREGMLSFLDHGVVLEFDDGLVDNPLWRTSCAGLLDATVACGPRAPSSARRGHPGRAASEDGRRQGADAAARRRRSRSAARGSTT